MQAKATQEARDELRRRRAALDESMALRRADAIERAPQIAQLEERIAHINHQTMQACVKDPQGTQARIKDARVQTAALRARIREALLSVGLPADVLDAQYTCAVCRDEGMLYDPDPRPCACFERLRSEAMIRRSGLSMNEPCSFATFDLGVFPDDPLPGLGRSQRAYMKGVLKLCTAYADQYPNADKRNLLFYGPSGLGKTYLLQSIARRTLERGVPTLAVTSYRMVDAMRAYHFGDGDASALSLMMDVDLLCIDDLGAEPVLENVTIVQLLALLTERRARGHGTVIATNLNQRELLMRYTERVASRLLDASTTMQLEFLGRDLRLSNR